MRHWKLLGGILSWSATAWARRFSFVVNVLKHWAHLAWRAERTKADSLAQVRPAVLILLHWLQIYTIHTCIAHVCTKSATCMDLSMDVKIYGFIYGCINVWIYLWMYGCIYGCINEWISLWMYGFIYRCMNLSMDVWIYLWMYEFIYEFIYGFIYGRMNLSTDAWI